MGLQIARIFKLLFLTACMLSVVVGITLHAVQVLAGHSEGVARWLRVIQPVAIILSLLSTRWGWAGPQFRFISVFATNGLLVGFLIYLVRSTAAADLVFRGSGTRVAVAATYEVMMTHMINGCMWGGIAGAILMFAMKGRPR